MDELQNKLLSEQNSIHASLPDGGADVLATVRRGARRRRHARALGTGAAAVLVVGVIGAGAWGLTIVDRADGLTPMVSDTPSPVASPLPRVTADVPEAPSPTVSAVDVRVGPPVDDSPDGIPEDGYPALAADRNTAKTAAAGIAYPRAHILEDWVWDRVGSGWSLEIVSAQLNPYEAGWEQPPAVMYLMSPETRYFEITELPRRAWDDARVVSWREGQDTAMLWWADNGTAQGRVGAGGALNLRTGQLDDLRMAVYGKTAYDYTFVMANAAGDELWKATSEAGFKYYRWSFGSDEDGWMGSALVDRAPDAQELSAYPGYDVPFVTADGDRLILGSNGGWESSNPTPLVAYSVSNDTVTFLNIDLPDGTTNLVAGDWIDSSRVKLTAEGDDLYRGMIVSLDGRVTYDDSVAGDGFDLNASDDRREVGFGLATPRKTAAVHCGC